MNSEPITFTIWLPLITAIISNLILARATCKAAETSREGILQSASEDRFFAAKTNAYSDLIRTAYLATVNYDRDSLEKILDRAIVAQLYSEEPILNAIEEYIHTLAKFKDSTDSKNRIMAFREIRDAMIYDLRQYKH